MITDSNSATAATMENMPGRFCRMLSAGSGGIINRIDSRISVAQAFGEASGLYRGHTCPLAYDVATGTTTFRKIPPARRVCRLNNLRYGRQECLRYEGRFSYGFKMKKETFQKS